MAYGGASKTQSSKGGSDVTAASASIDASIAANVYNAAIGLWHRHQLVGLAARNSGSRRQIASVTYALKSIKQTDNENRTGNSDQLALSRDRRMCAIGVATATGMTSTA